MLIVFLMIGTSAEIVFSAVLARHGARAPKTLYPFDKPHWSPESISQVTPFGMRQMYQLGQTLRAKYILEHSLLSESYIHHEVQILSTDVTRTLESAFCLGTGLYPPGTGPANALPFRLQSIPVFSETEGSEFILHAYKASTCARSDKIRAEVRDSEFYKQYEESIKEFLQGISAKLGFEVKGIQEASNVHGSMQCGHIDGIDLPGEITWEDYGGLGEIHTFHELNVPFSSVEALRIACSGLTQRLLGQFDAAVAGSPLKLAVYVAHDHTQIALLKCLGVPLDKIPLFASYITLDLHSDSTVSLYFNNEALESYSLESLHVRFDSFKLDYSTECSL